MGCVFYFVVNGSIENFFVCKSAKKILKKQLELMVKADNDAQEKNKSSSQEFLLNDLLMTILKEKPELRPSTQKILQHPVFWKNERKMELIFDIRKILDIISLDYSKQTIREFRRLLNQIDGKISNILSNNFLTKASIIAKYPDLAGKCQTLCVDIKNKIETKLNILDVAFKTERHMKLTEFFESFITEMGKINHNEQCAVLNNIKKKIMDVNINSTCIDTTNTELNSCVQDIIKLLNSDDFKQIAEKLIELSLLFDKNAQEVNEIYQTFLNTAKGAINFKNLSNKYQPTSLEIQNKFKELDPAFLCKLNKLCANLEKNLLEAIKPVDPDFEKNNEPFIIEIKQVFNVFEEEKVHEVAKKLQDIKLLRYIVTYLDKPAKQNQKKNWKTKLDNDLVKDLKGHYDFESVTDLLRAIRNKVIYFVKPINSSSFYFS